MKRPLRRKSNLERRRMIATETVASKIGGASPGRLRHRAVKKRKPRTYATTGGFQLLCYLPAGTWDRWWGENARLA